ncbi:Modification methylase BspRI [compost metagenome]
MQTLTYIDLFAGCGGLSLGFHKAKLKGLFAIEKSPDAFMTLKANLIDSKKHFDWPENIQQKNYDINIFLKKNSSFLKSLKGKVDLIAGGPPCQGFSTAGRRLPGDQRNSLVFSYLKFVELVSPKMILFENVQGFAQEFCDRTREDGGIKYSEYVIERLKALGYDVDFRLVDFSEFGVPQRRKRFILVGTKDIKNNFFDQLGKSFGTLKKKYRLTTQTTIAAAISDLQKECTDYEEDGRFLYGHYSPATSQYQKLMRKDVDRRQLPDSHRFVNHTKVMESRYRKLIAHNAKHGSISRVLLQKLGTKKRCVSVLNSDSVSPTVTTLPDDIVHYSEPRILTVREYARIQSFPDWFEFKGKYSTGGLMRRSDVPRYSQVGNAIPPLFAEVCGEAIQVMLRGVDEQG